MFECTLNMIEWYSVVDKDKSRHVSDWLKSLKERYTWKPSDEQIMVLAKASETYCGKDKGILYSLYNDLQNL